MSTKHVYTQKNLKFIRIISLAILILISYTTPIKFFDFLEDVKKVPYTGLDYLLVTIIFLLNISLIIVSALLLKYPEKFFLIGIEALAYSLGMAIVDSNAIMSLLMLCVTFSTLLLRSNFDKAKKKILIAFAFLYLFELLIPLKNGLEDFYRTLTDKIGISIIMGIILFFFFEYAKQIIKKESTKEKKLNIALYDGLERSDMFLLQDVLDHKKYKEIAKNIHGSEGYLRNKLSKIYKTLEVGDRTGFLAIYSGFEVIYEPIKPVEEPVNEQADEPVLDSTDEQKSEISPKNS